jgi:Spy/CpxP family protein refolding chaperone
MRDLHTRYYMETRGLRYDLMIGRLELIRLFLDPKADSTAILAKQGQVSALRQKLSDAMARMMVDARAILTPEQIQKLDMAFLAHAMGMGRAMMGHPMGPGMMHGGMQGHSMMGEGMQGHSMMGQGMMGGQGK